MIEERRLGLRLLWVLLDALLLSLWWAWAPWAREVLVALSPGGWIPWQPVDPQEMWHSGAWVVPVWLAVLHRRPLSPVTALRPLRREVVYDAMLAAAVVVVVRYVFKQPHLSRTVLWTFAVGAVGAAALSRWAVAWCADQLPRVVRRVLLVTAEPTTSGAWARLAEGSEWELQVLGRVVPTQPEATTRSVRSALHAVPVEEVWVLGARGVDLEAVCGLCAEQGLSMSLQLALEDGQAGRPHAALLRWTPVPVGQALVKRALDVVLAAVALVALAPVGMAVAAAIWSIDGGPVLHLQRRCGRYGVPFTMWKFRSMVRDAERLQWQLAPFNEVDGPAFKMRDDPRITRWGRFLRRWSLDELPQLVNVLVGDMSLVGPRPALPQEVARYEPWQRRRLSMRPGLTCTWQVSGRSDVPFEAWMRMDLEYIDRWSLLRDAWLLARTPWAVWTGIGAR